MTIVTTVKVVLIEMLMLMMMFLFFNGYLIDDGSGSKSWLRRADLDESSLNASLSNFLTLIIFLLPLSSGNETGAKAWGTRPCS